MLIKLDSIRCGIINGRLDNDGSVAWLPCGSLEVSLSPRDESANDFLGRRYSSSISLDAQDSEVVADLSLRPRIDVLLAVPSPRSLERMLPLLSMLGVDRIFLVRARLNFHSINVFHIQRFPQSQTGAAKVDVRYLASHLFLPKYER